jgi:hypothetical protein
VPDDDAPQPNASKPPAPASLLSSLGGFIAQVAKSPAAAVLAIGLLLVLVALVRDLGGFHLETRGSQYLTLATGLVLSFGGFGWPILAGRATQKRLESVADTQLPAVARDPAFLLKVLMEAMPPAFVKELDRNKPGRDLLQTTALVRTQQSSTRVSRDETLKQIKVDHMMGDRVAADNEASVQLELPDAVVHGKMRPIVTFKKLIEHKGKRYVAGWYVPVERAGISADDDEICLREEACQVLFRLAPAKAGEGMTIPVGKAIREALESVPKPRKPARPRKRVTQQ